jgi:enterochelin esterase-like enzyme
MRRALLVLASVGLCAALGSTRRAWASGLEAHPVVLGKEVETVRVGGGGEAPRGSAWSDLDRTALRPGTYELRFQADAGVSSSNLELPVCAGRGRVTLDGRGVLAGPGPVVLPLPPGEHDVRIAVVVSDYERRIACGGAPVIGDRADSVEGLGLLTFVSPWGSRGGGQAVVYVPPGHDARAPAPLQVGLHTWNGSIWTYAAYASLLAEARARDVVLLLPSGLGNSLYTADAEDEVLRAIAAVSERLAIDPRAVSLWGASMGGAGATTIGFHRPDRFASVTSFFGDSKYDRRTYVRAILRTEDAAHQVNALDVIENARHVPVWLVHGEDDRTSPVAQSQSLADALRARQFDVRFDRVPGIGHSGALVTRFLAELVDRAHDARVPRSVTRVSFRSVRPEYDGAYGVRVLRASTRGDAVIDVEARDAAIHVLRAEGVRAIVLAPGALGLATERPPAVIDDAGSQIDVRFEAAR